MYHQQHKLPTKMEQELVQSTKREKKVMSKIERALLPQYKPLKCG